LGGGFAGANMQGQAIHGFDFNKVAAANAVRALRGPVLALNMDAAVTA